MADTFWYIVMVPMVYLSLVWCIVWTVINIVKTLNAPALPRTLRIFPEGKGPDDPPESPLAGAFIDSFTMPTIRLFNPVFWWFLTFFHVALAILVLAHFDLLPQINIMPAKSPHMIGWGGIGVVFTVSLVYFLFRRFRGPVREVSVPGDFLILFLLICAAVSGDIISWGNSWTDSGFVLSKQELGEYLSSLVRLSFADPKSIIGGGHYPVIGAHVLFANLILLVFPFSKMMHAIFVVPLNKLRRG
jgi:nitrate reductase gamma subunit